MPTFEQVTSILCVRDVDASIAYYTEKLGFDWGVREMNVADPDGHRIRFGMGTDQPGDGVPLATD
jgi:catechol 2,3-dioxygenase-like lactoylglutathione lyase family enzyme